MKQENSQFSKKYESIKKFVNCLDLLIGHDDKNLFGIAAQEKIDQTIQQFPVVDEEGNQFSIFSSIQKFQKFGPGVYLMFKLLKHLMLMFVVISVICFIQFMFLVKSPYYQGYNHIVRINMLRLTIASLQPEDFHVYIGFDVLITLIVIIFLVYWSERLRFFATKCNQNTSLPSYLTVQLQNVEKDFTEQSLRSYLIQTQKIIPHEIYTGRNYGKFLKHYKKLTDTAIELRIMKELYHNQQQQQKKKAGAMPIIKKFLELKQKFCSIKAQKFNQRKYKPKQVFIVLKNYEDRHKLLSLSSNIITQFTKKRIQGQKDFQFKPCQVQPEAIAWENVGLSFINYTARALLVFFVLCIFTCLGVIVIFMLEVLETASIGDAYYFHEKHIGGTDVLDRRILQSQILCSDPQGNSCKMQADYGKLVLLILVTPLVVFICKKCFMALLSHFVHFRKYPSQVSRIKSETITLSIFYFIVIAVLHLVLYLKVDSNGLSIYELLHPIIIKLFNFTNYNPASIHLYSDYTLDWYKQATFFIVIIGVTSFNIANGFKFLIHFISFKLQKKKAQKQRTIYEVKKCLVGVNLHMQNVYASMIALIFFTFVYFCPIPLTIFFALINLTFLFYVTKWTFIKYGQKPLRIGHSINRTVTNLLLIGVVIHCFMTPIFLGAQGIATNGSHAITQKIQQEQISPHLGLGDRFRLFSEYVVIGVLMLVYILVRKPFTVYIAPVLKQKCSRKNNKGETQQKTEYRQYFGLYPSYSMHNSPKYSQILKNVYLLNRTQAKRATCPLPKSLKRFEDIPELQDDVRLRAFDQILEINRDHLDKQKYLDLYEAVESINRVSQSSFIKDNSEIQQDKATDDRIVANYALADQVKESVEE